MTVISVLLLGVVIFVIWQEAAVAPTVTNTANTSNANLTFETNANTTANSNTSTGVACTARTECGNSCGAITCGPTTQRYADCVDSQCRCYCIESGPEDTFDPSVQLYNGTVGAACTQDIDCILADATLDYRQCFAGYCDTVDYSLDNYVAVNATAFNDFRESIKDDGECGVQPACPTNFIDSGFRAACVDSVCRKVNK